MSEYIVPGDGFVDETAGEDQHVVPGDGMLDAESSVPPPTPSGRRRPVIIAAG